MEEEGICAFFDTLGTRDIMLSNDNSRRNALIELVRQLAERQSRYSVNVQNIGPGIAMSPAAQSSTFSDNVVVSFPLKRMSIPGIQGNQAHTFYVEAESFFENLIIQIVVTVWDGLKIGVLFRGPVTVGRLIHDDKVIAGEALVKAVELEKSTKLPRIETASDVIDLVDDNGRPIVNEYTKKDCLEQVDGRWFVRAFAFHAGYWRDHNYYRQQRNEGPEDIPVVLTRIRSGLDTEYERVIDQG